MRKKRKGKTKILNLNNDQEVTIVIVQEIDKYLYKIQKLAASVAFFCWMIACKQADISSTALVNERFEKRLNVYEQKVMLEMNSLVQTGDLVTRRGGDMTSYIMAKMNQTDTLFSHCGIASREGDSVFVYHAIGGEFNPDQRLKREWLYSFAHPSDNQAVGLFRPSLQQGDTMRLLAFVKAAYASGMMFDAKFDLDTDDRQYCTEFAAKSYATLGESFNWQRLVKTASIKFIPVENLFLNKMMVEINRWSY